MIAHAYHGRMRLFLLVAFLGLVNASPAQSAARVQVFGAVIGKDTGKPVYDCTVEHHDPTGKRWSFTMVNSDGRYAMFIPTGEAFDLWVVRENGYKELRQHFEPIPPGTATFEADLSLEPK